MNLLRKLKINELTPVDFTNQEQEVLSNIDNIAKDLTLYRHPTFPKSVYYFDKQGTCLFDIYKDSQEFILFINGNLFKNINLEQLKDISMDDVYNIFKIRLKNQFPIYGNFDKVTSWYGHRISFLEKEYKKWKESNELSPQI